MAMETLGTSERFGGTLDFSLLETGELNMKALRFFDTLGASHKFISGRRNRQHPCCGKFFSRSVIELRILLCPVRVLVNI
jgi:hypothetical protein